MGLGRALVDLEPERDLERLACHERLRIDHEYSTFHLPPSQQWSQTALCCAASIGNWARWTVVTFGVVEMSTHGPPSTAELVAPIGAKTP